ncbi:hypothetical protein SERLADRAFT_378580, partial [Serpula lacrymans var. lacrymans S7.9]
KTYLAFLPGPPTRPQESSSPSTRGCFGVPIFIDMTVMVRIYTRTALPFHRDPLPPLQEKQKGDTVLGHFFPVYPGHCLVFSSHQPKDENRSYVGL